MLFCTVHPNAVRERTFLKSFIKRVPYANTKLRKRINKRPFRTALYNIIIRTDNRRADARTLETQKKKRARDALAH